MAEGRPQLYKIRRLVRETTLTGFEEYFQYMTNHDEEHPSWDKYALDGWSTTSLKEAQRMCEHIKVKNRDHRVLYHAVVPYNGG
jgi:hypothetical protein